ncbi:type II toxin-antitoxin system VapC family toxin [Lacunimicrobium album]
MVSESQESILLPILVDTNILLRLCDSAHPLSASVEKAIEILNELDCEIVIVPQVLFEFWCVATRSVAANGLGKSPEFTRGFIDHFRILFQLIPDRDDLFDEWFHLVNVHQLKGVNSYDARLAAAMKCSGLPLLLTMNEPDFRRYAHISILTPDAILTSRDLSVEQLSKHRSR